MINEKVVAAIAANLAAMSFIVGFGLYFTLLMDSNYARLDLEPLSQVKFLVENQLLLHFWYQIIYVFFGFTLALLCLVLYQRLCKGSPLMTRVATVIGLIWAGLVIASGLIVTVGNLHVIEIYPRDPEQAVDLWLVVQVLSNALGGGNEIVGGLWMVFINLVALRTVALTKVLVLTGLIAGVAGVLTIVPGWQSMAAVFGAGCIFWFGGLAAFLFSEQRHDLTNSIA